MYDTNLERFSPCSHADFTLIHSSQSSSPWIFFLLIRKQHVRIFDLILNRTCTESKQNLTRMRFFLCLQWLAVPKWRSEHVVYLVVTSGSGRSCAVINAAIMPCHTNKLKAQLIVGLAPGITKSFDVKSVIRQTSSEQVTTTSFDTITIYFVTPGLYTLSVSKVPMQHAFHWPHPVVKRLSQVPNIMLEYSDLYYAAFELRSHTRYVLGHPRSKVQWAMYAHWLYF